MFLESHGSLPIATPPPNAPPEVMSLGVNNAMQAIANGTKLRIFIFQFLLDRTITNCQSPELGLN